MYVFHAWIVLLDSTDEGEPSVIWEKAALLKPILHYKFQLSSDAGQWLTITNGLHILNASFSRNHRATSHAELLEVLNWICKELPGSYGLVYWHDDEDPAIGDAFRVIVMARGQLRDHVDQFLSPRNPVVED
jgi:immunity protein 7 of polymorphic toxin system